MEIAEVCLETNDVLRMSSFYRWLLGVAGESDDAVHQTILSHGTMLTVYNNGVVKPNNNRNITLAFTVEDIQAQHQRLVQRGVTILEEPAVRPWGAVNMSFLDPDDNVIYLRQLPH